MRAVTPPDGTKRAPWHDLLEIPQGVADPDHYQVVGVPRARFAAASLEPAYARRLERLRAHRDPRVGAFVALAIRALEQARRVLSDPAERAAYDRDLVARREAALRERIPAILEGKAWAPDSERKATLAGLKLGMTEEEALRVVAEFAPPPVTTRRREPAPGPGERAQTPAQARAQAAKTARAKAETIRRTRARPVAIPETDDGAPPAPPSGQGPPASLAPGRLERHEPPPAPPPPRPRPPLETVLEPANPAGAAPRDLTASELRRPAIEPARVRPTTAPQPIARGPSIERPTIEPAREQPSSRGPQTPPGTGAPHPPAPTHGAGHTPPPAESSKGATLLDVPSGVVEAATAAKENPKPASINSLVGRTLDDRYEILAKLGEGGMGAVFKAQHLLLQKPVALKIVNPILAERPQVRERFLREARAAMEFVHPNAVPLRDFGLTREGILYMTQDFSPGKSLREVLNTDGPLEAKRALFLIRQCLLALAEAHRKGIVHRDVKPENVLVEAQDVVRVCDFGIAKIMGENKGQEATLTGGTVIGTPDYMAPEQGAGDKVDARTDLYAIGCVLFEILTGRRVFEAETAVQIIMRHVTQAPEAPSAVVGTIPPGVDALVLKALEKAPSARWQTADEFVAAIDAVSLAPATSKKRLSREGPALRASGSRSSLTSSQAVSGSQARSAPSEDDRVDSPAARVRDRSAIDPAGPRSGGSSPHDEDDPAEQSDAGLTKSGASRGSGFGRTSDSKHTPSALSDVKFCARCSVSVPDNWRETGRAARVGMKLFCAECAKPMLSGKACMGCSRPIAPGEKAANGGGGMKVCSSCAARAEKMHICHRCQAVLPKVLFDRGEAVSSGGKTYCSPCYKKRKAARAARKE